MSKKILIYGLAFGSLSAALSYIYFTSSVYKNGMGVNLFFMLSEFIIIPTIAIWLFLKSYKAERPDEFIMGRTIFLGFFISVMISATVSLLFSYLLHFKPFYVEQLIQYKIKLINESGIDLKKTPAEIKAAKENIEFSYTGKAQLTNQLFTGAARGLLVSAIISFLMKAKMNPANDDNTKIGK